MWQAGPETSFSARLTPPKSACFFASGMHGPDIAAAEKTRNIVTKIVTRA